MGVGGNFLTNLIQQSRDHIMLCVFFKFYFCCSSPFFFLRCFVTCAYNYYLNKKTDNFPIIIFQTSFINL